MKHSMTIMDKSILIINLMELADYVFTINRYMKGNSKMGTCSDLDGAFMLMGSIMRECGKVECTMDWVEL